MELDRDGSCTNIVNVVNAIELFIKDQTTNTYLNMNEPQGKGKVARHKELHIVEFHLHEMFRKRKVQRQKTVQWLPRAWVGMGIDPKEAEGQFQG